MSDAHLLAKHCPRQCLAGGCISQKLGVLLKYYRMIQNSSTLMPTKMTRYFSQKKYVGRVLTRLAGFTSEKKECSSWSEASAIFAD
jgi:hypothetical protein